MQFHVIVSKNPTFKNNIICYNMLAENTAVCLTDSVRNSDCLVGGYDYDKTWIRIVIESQL